VKRSTVKLKVPWISHRKVKVLVVVIDVPVTPAPEMIGESWERSMTRGYIVTRAREATPLGFVASVREKCVVPFAERAATASWWTIEKVGVVPACAAVGHVTVARQRSTRLPSCGCAF
jgi:hypothetical protein